MMDHLHSDGSRTAEIVTPAAEYAENLTEAAIALLRSLPREIWMESDDGQMLFALARDGHCKYTRMNSTLGRFEHLAKAGIDERERGYVEGFAAALQAMTYAITGDCGCGKSYDPMVIEGDTMHSYAFDMKDGGRHHPIKGYSSAQEICAVLYQETLDGLNEDGVKLARLESVARFLTALDVHEGRRT